MLTFNACHVHHVCCPPLQILSPMGAQFIAFGLMIMSAWALSQFADFKDLISAESLLLLALTGLFVFIVAMIGCVGTLWMQKYLLFAYAGFVFVLTILIAVGAIAMLIFAGHVDAAYSNAVTDPVVGELHSFVNCSYNKCCVPEKDGSFNFGTRVELSLEDASRMRALEVPCDSTIGVAGAVCGVLYDMDINNIENCNEFPKYKTSLNDWMKSNFATMGYITLAISIIQFLALTVSCGLICTTDHTPKVDPNEDFDEY